MLSKKYLLLNRDIIENWIKSAHAKIRNYPVSFCEYWYVQHSMKLSRISNFGALW